MRHTLGLLVAVAFLGSAGITVSTQSSSPGIDALLTLKRVRSPAISPDGRRVAYTIRETNWHDNEFETEIWVGGAGAQARQMTSGRKSSQQPAWSPDGKRIAFVSDREVQQVFVAAGCNDAMTLGVWGIG